MIDSAATQTVLIAGGGIGGMTLALTLHQIGVPCVVYEAVADPQPLGVGINLQPNAVRELYDLGIDTEMLDSIGIQAREWALVGRNGNDVYAEPRGLLAGYRWPQYSVHRGKLQMLLYRTVLERLGSDAVRLGQRVTGYRERVGGITALIESRANVLSRPMSNAATTRAESPRRKKAIWWSSWDIDRAYFGAYRLRASRS